MAQFAQELVTYVPTHKGYLFLAVVICTPPRVQPSTSPPTSKALWRRVRDGEIGRVHAARGLWAGRGSLGRRGFTRSTPAASRKLAPTTSRA